jgi:predicted PurR-regulated permease PerM
MVRKVEISHRTIIFTVFFIISLWFLFLIRDLIFQLFVALIIMATFNPFVTKLQKYKIPRSASVILVYAVFVGVLGSAFFAIIPQLAEQTANFVSSLPKLMVKLGVPIVFRDQILEQLLAQVGAVPSQLAKALASIFSNVFAVITVFIFSFYLLLSRDKLDDQLGYFFGEDKREKIGKIIDRLEVRMGSWARGEAILMFVIGLSTYIGLRLLSVPFALPLAILAGILEIIPYIGPIISAVPAVVLGFGISPITGLATAALAFLIQQLENYVLVPKIMQSSTGINPIVTLFALTIGFRLAGILGVFLSIPIVITLQVVFKQYSEAKS